MSIRKWQQHIHGWAKRKGWYDEPRSVGDFLTNIHAEVSEAWEEYRDGHDLTAVRGVPVRCTETDEIFFKPLGFSVELADTVIRIFDLCEHLGIDLEAAIEEKMAFNERRPYRHGGKRA